MKNEKIFLIVFLLFCFSRITYAYIPPTFYIAEKIAKPRSSIGLALIQYELQKPSTNSQDTKTTSATLWVGSVVYPNNTPTQISKKTWPLLNLLLEGDSNKLLLAWKNFGISVHTEKDLVIKKNKSEKNRSTDTPFYSFEENTSIRRYNADTKVIEITGSDKITKIYVDKNTFKPIAIFGECPNALSSGGLFHTSQGDTCSLEFQYGATNFPIPLPSRISLKMGDRELLIMKINRLLLNPNSKTVRDLTEKQSDLLVAADDLVQGFHQYFFH